jgi:hypothetical protein
MQMSLTILLSEFNQLIVGFRRKLFRLALWCALTVCLVTSVRAQQYGFDVWTTANGLPSLAG